MVSHAVTGGLSGYVADIPYVRTFIPMLAPAWLDHAALLNGVIPPRRTRGFSWCDLGCGPGLTAALLAGTHPNGEFHGIDANPEHISYARGFAAEANISNAKFHAMSFAAAAQLSLPRFDYIVAHGVLSWVAPAIQQELLRFIDRHLKPGGLAYLSYNAMPGWSVDLPLQRLLFEFGKTASGNSLARVEAAMTIVNAHTAAKSPPLMASPARGLLSEKNMRRSTAYLAHEFLNANWQPLYVTDVRKLARPHGLTAVGSAQFMDNYDRYVLRAAARAELTDIADEDQRELARDYFSNKRFRCDVFQRSKAHLHMEANHEDERAAALLERTYALSRPASKVRYRERTASGHLRFDNAVTRGIVASLADGPRSLSSIRLARVDADDLLANALTLCAANQIRPVEATSVDVTQLRATILGRVDGPDEVLHMPLRCGTAVPVERDLLRALRDQTRTRKFAPWRAYLGDSA